MWIYFVFVIGLVLAIVLKSINVWLGAAYAFIIVFGFGVYDIYDEYKWHRFKKEYMGEVIWHLVKYFIYGVLGAALLSFSGGDDPYINDSMEYLEPR